MNKDLIENFILDLNNYKEKDDVLTNIVKFLRKNCEAFSVAIRIQDGEDFPYYSSVGFSDNFIKSENHLCCVKNGKIERDAKNKAILECVCGSILSKANNIKNCPKCYTKSGGFWTNSVDNLIKETEGNIGVKTRGTCVESGYKSIAIIPIPYKDKNMGLIQLNDFKENKFTNDLIDSVEILAAMIGKVLEKIDEEEAIKKERRKMKKKDLMAFITNLKETMKRD